MKILIINSVSGIKSTGRIATDIAQQFIADGHECRIAYGREAALEKYSDISYRISSDTEVKINALKVRVFDNEGFNAKKATKRFLKWADEYNPDVLWLHNLHGYYINIKLLFDWIKSRPQMKVKWTLHDCWALTGHCSYFTLEKCEKWKDGCYKCSQKKKYPASMFLDDSKRNYIRKKTAFCGVKQMEIITPSQWLADLVKQSFLKEYPVHVVYNTIDMTVFKPTESDFREKYNLEEKKIVLGVAAPWSERKGLNDFIKLSNMLDESYQVVLVGLKQEQIKQLPEKILGIEKTNNIRELAEIYTAADVFLNLTYEDNYPTVNLESQACGTPCITYHTGGSVESVQEINIVEQGDIDGVITAIKRIVERK